MTTQRGTECKNNQISMNANATYYIHSCLGPNIPEIVLRSVQDDHKVKFVFELNEGLEENLKDKALSERLDLSISVGNGQYKGRLLWPICPVFVNKQLTFSKNVNKLLK